MFVVAGAERFVCGVCHRKLPTKQSLEKHEVTHQSAPFKLKGKGGPIRNVINCYLYKMLYAGGAKVPSNFNTFPASFS